MNLGILVVVKFSRRKTEAICLRSAFVDAPGIYQGQSQRSRSQRVIVLK